MGKRISKNATASDFTATTTTTSVPSTAVSLTTPQDIEQIAPTADDIVIISKDAIKNHLKLLDIAVKTFKRGFLLIGFHLLWFRDTLAYKQIEDKEYKNIESFAKDRYDISRSTTYSYIQVAERFGQVNPETKEIDSLKEEYKDFSPTALMVMCTLDDETVAKCKSNMKVKDIKALAAAKDEDDEDPDSTDEDDEDPDGTDDSTDEDDKDTDDSDSDINSDDSRLKGVCLLHINTVEELENKKEYIFDIMKKILTQKTAVSYTVGILQLDPPEIAKQA